MAFIDLLQHADVLFQNTAGYLNKIIVALVILLLGFMIGKIIEISLKKLFATIAFDEKMTRFFVAKRQYARSVVRIVARLIYVVTILLVLNRLSLLEETYTLLLLFALLIIVLSFVLAGLDFIPNIVARVACKKKGLCVGDEITLMDKSGVIQGTIVDITLTDVRMKRKNGDLFFIPLALFSKERVVKKKQ